MRQGDAVTRGRFESETERLELRRFSPEDASGFFALNQDPEVIRYTGDVAFLDERAAREFIAKYDHYERYGFGRWSVSLKESGEYLGFCGLKYSPAQDEVDLGFRFRRACWGRGIATEAGRECLRLGFERYDLQRIVGRAMAANPASLRVLEKLGMVQTNRFLQEGRTWIQYGIDRQRRSQHEAGGTS